MRAWRRALHRQVATDLYLGRLPPRSVATADQWSDGRYRSDAEFAAWRARCPLERLRERIVADGALGAAELEGVEAGVLAELDDAVRFAKESPFPLDGELHTDVHGA